MGAAEINYRPFHAVSGKVGDPVADAAAYFQQSRSKIYYFLINFVVGLKNKFRTHAPPEAVSLSEFIDGPANKLRQSFNGSPLAPSDKLPA